MTDNVRTPEGQTLTRSALILDLPPSATAHLVVAISEYRRRLRRDHITEPPELAVLAGSLLSRVSEGQAGSLLAERLPDRESAGVPRRLVNYGEAAEMLACSASTIKRLIAAEELTPVRIGGTPRLAIADLDALIERSTKC
jgi:excisionase family DNA binding protein